MRLVTGTGGGWGDPMHRPEEEVRNDLTNGYISEAEAREVYGLASEDDG